jgi:chromosomal replication initiation ATPase DnaA
MSAIGNHVAQRRPSLSVTAVTLDEFVGELHTAISDGPSAFKARYSASASALIDDIQFLTAPKRRRASCCASSTHSRAMDGRSS